LLKSVAFLETWRSKYQIST